MESGESAAAYKARILSYQAGTEFLALQAAAPEKLAALVESLTSAQLTLRPAPDKWSIQELVAHLAEDELVGAYRLRMVLSSPGTPLQAFDQDVWAVMRDELRGEMGAMRDDLKRHTDMRIEDVRDDIRMLADGFASLSGRIDRLTK